MADRLDSSSKRLGIARVVERAEERVPWEVRLWDWIVRDDLADCGLE
jgi:hypothetical protein